MKWIKKSFDVLSTFELYQILALRSEVFVLEQDCPYQDVDGRDIDAYHILGYDVHQDLVGYARILKPGISYPEIAIGRVVVSPKYRGRGLGGEVMRKSISFIENKMGVQPIRLSAQAHLQGFYEDLDFIYTGKSYLEDGIPHREMLRN